MEIILTKRVEHLGDRGAIVRVADGYARNYLLPTGQAIVASRGARKQAEAMQRAEDRREEQRRDAALIERDKLHGKAVTVRARANAEGKLYGSVAPKDITEALRETHGVTADPDRCQIEEHIRDLGQHTVTFHVYRDIVAEVTVTVKAIEGEKPAEAPAAEVRSAPKPKPIITGGARQG